MVILRRTLLLWLFMFWQGGFLFYGAIVVTIGSEVLASDFRQGMITRRVAVALNVTGAIVLFAWLWDLLIEQKSHRRRRWASWGFLALTVATLFWLHPQMDALIDLENRRLLDYEEFRSLHRWYLRISTIQSVIAIAFSVWTLKAWGMADRVSGWTATSG